jgi:hypothetical protein
MSIDKEVVDADNYTFSPTNPLVIQVPTANEIVEESEEERDSTDSTKN